MGAKHILILARACVKCPSSKATAWVPSTTILDRRSLCGASRKRPNRIIIRGDSAKWPVGFQRSDVGYYPGDINVPQNFDQSLI